MDQSISLHPKDLLERFPDDVNILALFTDYHWTFKRNPPFSCNDHYYIWSKKYDINTPITTGMLDDALRSSVVIANSFESVSVQLHLNTLKKLQKLLLKK